MYSTIILFLVHAVFTYALDPTVVVEQGQLRGSVRDLPDGTKYYSFKGVPYAEPPVGPLRFKAPQPPKPWTGVRDAINHGPVCPQFDFFQNLLIEGNEDCLFVNVYTKNLRPKHKQAVMVYIHGGGNLAGSGDADTFGPEYLIQHDVILVTLNYRLEVLGFLTLDIPEAPGNAALKDQVAALRWVKRNIAKFGGDPNKVTIFGESSGACSVTYHMLSPMSSGLFHNAIAESGVAIQDFAVGVGGRERAFRVGKVLGKDTKDPEELLQFLRSLPAVRLTNLTLSTRTEEEARKDINFLFIPTVEKHFSGIDSFITDNPVDLLATGRVINGVPMINGYNSGEGILSVQSRLDRLDHINRNLDMLVPLEIARSVSADQVNELALRIRNFYIGDRDFTRNDTQAIADIDTDAGFLYNIHRFTYFASSHNSVFMYRFNYVTDLNVVKKGTGLTDLKGASHADELFYLFYNAFNKDLYEKQPALKAIIDRLTKMWADFAKTSNPTPGHEIVQWRPYTRPHKEFLNIDEPYSMGRYTERERMEFWNTLYKDAGVPHMKRRANKPGRRG